MTLVADRAPSPPTGVPVTGPVALVGVTASGKSAAAVAVARRSAVAGTAVEVVSVDSMAVYRGMDIGTDKPPAEVRREVPHHLVDVADPSEDFSVRAFQRAAADATAGIAGRSARTLFVGGTGLYLRAVVDGLDIPGRYPEVADRLATELDAAGPPGADARRAHVLVLHRHLAGLDPVAATRMEPGNERRVRRALEVTLGSGRPFSSYGPGLERYPAVDVAMVGIRPDADALGRRIADRLARQMDAGFLEEVRTLAARPAGLSRTARQALGYRELLSHLEEGVPLDRAVAEAERRTRALARRQWAWFRRDPRIHWVASADEAVDWVVGHWSGSGPVEVDGGRDE
jgi:tRNA dimethylallyltransferase